MSLFYLWHGVTAQKIITSAVVAVACCFENLYLFYTFYFYIYHIFIYLYVYFILIFILYNDVDRLHLHRNFIYIYIYIYIYVVIEFSNISKNYKITKTTVRFNQIFQVLAADQMNIQVFWDFRTDRLVRIRTLSSYSDQSKNVNKVYWQTRRKNNTRISA